jgi:hypothetical protein
MRRFLRAYNLDVNKAINRFRAVQDWRVEHAISKCYLRMDVQCYEDYRKMVSSSAFLSHISQQIGDHSKEL